MSPSITIAPSRRPAIGAARLSAVLSGALLLSLGNATAGAEATGTTAVTGTWQSHKYSFQYLGFTSTYSCDGLADKLKMLLLAAGARSDVKSEPGACASGFGRPDKFARADLTFSTLAPVQGAAAAEAKPVNGVWRAVSFSANSPRDLKIGDCELVEQFRSQVLPMFTTRNIADNTTCVPHQDSGSTVNLNFEVFAAPKAVKH